MSQEIWLRLCNEFPADNLVCICGDHSVECNSMTETDAVGLANVVNCAQVGIRKYRGWFLAIVAILS